MDAIRIGKPTSSSAHRMMGTPKVLATYVKEKQRELDLGIEMSVESTSHALSWGRAMESYVHANHCDFTYSIESQKTTLHPSKMWCGTKDLIKPEISIADIKCPVSRTSFCDAVDIINSKSTAIFKEENPEHYWQLISNSILENVPAAEYIVWMPYHSEIPSIIEHIEDIDDYQTQLDIQWLAHVPHSRIPSIPEGKKYKNINKFLFDVPKDDVDLFMERVEKCHKLIHKI